jgi:hypothetical protein
MALMVASPASGGTLAPALAKQRQAYQRSLGRLAEKNGWLKQMVGDVLYVNIPGGTTNDSKELVRACGRKSIHFWKKPLGGSVYHHLYTRLGSGLNLSHGLGGLSGHDWRPPDDAIGVLGVLTRSETKRTEEFAKDNQERPTRATNRWGTIGSFDATGGGGGAQGTSHCTNYWDVTKVGDGGESMPRLFGLGGTGIASHFIGDLMRPSSKRVYAVVLYGDGVRDFGAGTLSRFFR